MNVAVQLMIPKRLLLKNDENLDILIYGVIANHGMVKLLDCEEIFRLPDGLPCNDKLTKRLFLSSRGIPDYCAHGLGG